MAMRYMSAVFVKTNELYKIKKEILYHFVNKILSVKQCAEKPNFCVLNFNILFNSILFCYVQNWFDKCSHSISSVTKQAVDWITPLSFPCVQPYFKLGGYGVYSEKHDSYL